MPANMQLDDLMDLLAAWGSLSLSRSRFPSAGSPHLKGRSVEWKCELRIPGYKTTYGEPRFETTGKTCRDAVEACYIKAEAYFSGPEGRAGRQAYLDEYAFYVERFEKANTYQRMGFDAIRHPGKLLPDVYAGEAPAIGDERFD